MPCRNDPCSICGGDDSEGLILLCDECDATFHALCHRPPKRGPLLGDWLCAECRPLHTYTASEGKETAI